jgi:hypothetical protein
VRVDRVDPSSRVGTRVGIRLRTNRTCKDMPHRRVEDGVSGTIVRCTEFMDERPHP